MPVLDNSRHEKFAQEVAKGMDATAAYISVYGKSSRSSANSSAARLLANVRFRVQELKEASATATTLTMQERRERLARIVRCDLTRIDTSIDGDLVQEITTSDGVVKLRLPGKRECIMDDAKLAGELTEKLELSGQLKATSADVLAAVRLSPALRGLPLPADALGNS